LLVKAKHHRKILFSLGEKEIRRAQNEKSKEYFSVVRRASARGGGAASLVPFSTKGGSASGGKVGSREVYNYSTKSQKHQRPLVFLFLLMGIAGIEPTAFSACPR